MAAVAAGSGIWALVDSMNPAKDTIAQHIADVDISKIGLGQKLMVAFNGKPVILFHRTANDIRDARAEDWRGLRDPADDKTRVQRGHDEWLVLFGVCTHLDCIIRDSKSDYLIKAGRCWYCPCCGSSYDKSGRVRSGPAPKNLKVAEYILTDKNTIRLGQKPDDYVTAWPHGL
jgi:ubiquinol-cytochrome c reductase iron-sulfur subunit